MRQEARDATGRWATALLGSFTLMDIIRELKYDERYTSVIERMADGGSILWEVPVVGGALALFYMYQHPLAGKRPPRFPGKK